MFQDQRSKVLEFERVNKILVEIKVFNTSNQFIIQEKSKTKNFNLLKLVYAHISISVKF